MGNPSLRRHTRAVYTGEIASFGDYGSKISSFCSACGSETRALRALTERKNCNSLISQPIPQSKTSRKARSLRKQLSDTCRSTLQQCFQCISE